MKAYIVYETFWDCTCSDHPKTEVNQIFLTETEATKYLENPSINPRHQNSELEVVEKEVKGNTPKEKQQTECIIALTDSFLSFCKKVTETVKNNPCITKEAEEKINLLQGFMKTAKQERADRWKQETEEQTNGD